MSNIMDDITWHSWASSNMSLGRCNSRRFRKTQLWSRGGNRDPRDSKFGKEEFFRFWIYPFQFAGGVDFNAEFVDSSPSLLLSRNPFAVDSVAWNFLSRIRASQNLKARKKENALMFKYARSLGLGKVDNPIIFSVSSK